MQPIAEILAQIVRFVFSLLVKKLVREVIIKKREVENL
jgi:hypothetical protein